MRGMSPARPWSAVLEGKPLARMMACMSRSEEMRELFTRWKSSGQSLAAFGNADGITYAKLLYWRKKLGADAQRKAPPKQSPKQNLAPVHIVPDGHGVTLTA